LKLSLLSFSRTPLSSSELLVKIIFFPKVLEISTIFFIVVSYFSCLVSDTCIMITIRHSAHATAQRKCNTLVSFLLGWSFVSVKHSDAFKNIYTELLKSGNST
jgi:hypothetical protein